MPTHEFQLQADDNHQTTGFHWQARDARAVVMLLHGMAEHAARYQRFADTLNQEGYSVIAPNLRGHGPNTPRHKQGHFSESDGWQKVLSDISLAHQFVTAKYIDKPVILMGHSMGSFLAQSWLIDKPAPLNGVILSGSNHAPMAIAEIWQSSRHCRKIQAGNKRSQ